MKLKIRAVNESNTQKTLTEADVNRGYRIKAIEKLSSQVGAAVTKAKYKYKPVSQSGFYIMPDYGYLSKLVITGTDEEEPTFSVKLNDVHAEQLLVNGKAITKLTDTELIELADDIGLAMAKTLVAPASFDAVSESLTEDAILEYGPLSAIKGFFKQTLPDFFAKKAANKAEKQGTKAILDGINETLSESLEQAVKALLKDGKQYVTVDSKIDGNTLTLQLKCDFVTALTFNADPKDPRKVIVSKLLTPLGEVRVKGKTIPQVLAMVGKVLGIKFDIDVPDPVDHASDEIDPEGAAVDVDTDAEDSTDWESLIGAEAFAHLAEGVEHLSELESVLEAYKLGISADKYLEAFNAAATPGAKENVIRYFLFKESAGKLSEDAAKKLDTKSVTDITDIIKEKKSFNPNAVFELLYILKFIQKYGKIESVALELAKNLPDSCKNSGTLENMKSILYSEILFNSANDITTLTKLLNFWYKNEVFKKVNLLKLSEANLQTLVTKFNLADDLPTKANSDYFAIKRELLLDKAKKSFRSIADIEGIAQAIKNSKTASASRGGDVVEDPVDTPAELDLDTLDVDTITEDDFKKLIKLATGKGGSSADRIRIAKALLTSLTEA